MNILIPHHWLLDHLKTKANPQQLQEYLSLSGPSVENIEEVEGDKVYDIEITTNRVDAMSVRGIAREAAVILTRYKLNSQLKPLDLKTNNKLQTAALPLPTINNNQGLCQRIMCVVIANVKQKTSPRWLGKRLRQAGFQEHKNLIDITNYITHDLGHPCHVFDYDKIMSLGGVINVGVAQKGKPFVTLDGIERETMGGEIVFTNEVGTIIDLPAIIGTANSCVGKNTKNILFWMEDLDAQKVRQASINHAIRTTAAQLNEKGVDPTLAKEELLKGIELYQKIAGGKVASKIYDDYAEPRKVPAFKVKGETINKYLGLELDKKQVQQILVDLGCEVDLINNSATATLGQLTLEINPPTFRPDLKIPADAIEEIARIYGYQNLPSTLMAGNLPVRAPKDVNFSLEHKIKQFLSNIGWQEIYSISLISQSLAEQSGFTLDEHLQLLNPLTTDNQYLRRSLIPSLEEAMAANPQAEQLSVFELATVYEPKTGELPDQTLKLGLVSTKPYQQFRGDLQALLDQFYFGAIMVNETTSHKNKAAITPAELIKQKAVINILDPENPKQKEVKLGEILILNNGHLAAQLDYPSILKLAKKYPNYQPRMKTSPIIEDLTFTLSPETKIGNVLQAMKDLDPLIIDTKLTDVYQHNFTFEIHYQDPSKNLTSEELQPVRKKLVTYIETQFQANLVGQV